MLLVEVEEIVNSCPLTTDVLNDVTSLAHFSPKSKIVVPLPGHFTSQARYCRKYWRRVQHLSNEFWNQWRKEVLLTLLNCGK